MKNNRILKTLEYITALSKIDDEIYQNVVGKDQFLDEIREQQGSWFLNFYLCLDMVWVQMFDRGTSMQEGYEMFKSSRHDREDKPIAWYTTEWSTKGDGSIKGVSGYTGYIPDQINDVILSHDITAKEKLKLLKRMFADLKKLRKNYKRGHNASR